MEWITDGLPHNTGTYLVSIMRQRSFGIQAFTYVAHYDVDAKIWYKYDPFDDNHEPKEEIQGQVTAWNDVPVFIK